MNRLVGILSTVIIILSVVSGFFFYQLDAVQSVNSELRSQNVEVQEQLDELQTQNEELETQIIGLQNQIDEQETQLNHYANLTSRYTNLVEITAVKIESTFTYYGGVTCYNGANVTIENPGVNDVEGLTLIVVHSSEEGFPYTKSLAVLHSGEKREVTSAVYSLCGYTGWVTVTLKLGNVTLDEYIVPNFP